VVISREFVFWNRIAGWQDYLISREIVFETGLQGGKII